MSLILCFSLIFLDTCRPWRRPHGKTPAWPIDLRPFVHNYHLFRHLGLKRCWKCHENALRNYDASFHSSQTSPRTVFTWICMCRELVSNVFYSIIVALGCEPARLLFYCNRSDEKKVYSLDHTHCKNIKRCHYILSVCVKIKMWWSAYKLAIFL